MTQGNEPDWIGYSTATDGRPSTEGDAHLSVEQRRSMERRADSRARERGGHKAIVVVDVYENGEAVPHVEIPKGSSVHPTDLQQVEECVALAADALSKWQ